MAQLEWLPGAQEAIDRLTAAGWPVVVVTNQAGIARGYYSEEQFHRVTAWMCEQFERRGDTVRLVPVASEHLARVMVQRVSRGRHSRQCGSSSLDAGRQGSHERPNLLCFSAPYCPIDGS